MEISIYPCLICPKILKIWFIKCLIIIIINLNNFICEKKYNQLSIKYNEILQDLNNSNENIRKKACENYKEYKELKYKLEQKRNEYKKTQKNIDEKISKNKQKKMK